MKKVLMILTVLSAIGVVMAGCSGGGDSGGAAAAPAKTDAAPAGGAK